VEPTFLSSGSAGNTLQNRRGNREGKEARKREREFIPEEKTRERIVTTLVRKVSFDNGDRQRVHLSKQLFGRVRPTYQAASTGGFRLSAKTIPQQQTFSQGAMNKKRKKVKGMRKTRRRKEKRKRKKRRKKRRRKGKRKRKKRRRKRKRKRRKRKNKKMTRKRKKKKRKKRQKKMVMMTMKMKTFFYQQRVG
jgi:hypothetical protein